MPNLRDRMSRRLGPIGVANGHARRPTKYPAGPENVPAVKTERSPWQALVGATGYAPRLGMPF